MWTLRAVRSDGLDSVEYLTTTTIWDLESLPHHLIIVGGGPVGCEMAQAFRRLGAKVTIVQSLDRLLPRDDREASRVLGEIFQEEGIKVLYGSRAAQTWQDEDGIHSVHPRCRLAGCHRCQQRARSFLWR